MKTNLWSSAAANGLLLSLITVILLLVQTAFPMGTAVAILFWIVKLVATVGLLFYFMKDFGKPQESYRYGTAFSYGFAVSFCSNIVIACYLFIHSTVIFPDSLEKSLEAMQQVFSQYNLDSSITDMVMNNLPVISSLSTLLIYTIEGVIFSAILANFAKKAEQPFANEIE